jgi:uncharacterized DUF497 family protein
MIIVWDEPKRRRNLAKHGLDFAALTPAFFLGSRVVPAHSGRFKAMGRLEDDTVAVVFARLGSEGVSIVSMRPASPRERRLYEQAHQA